MSCSTGKADINGDCVAQYLADKLKVNVYAPVDTVCIQPTGVLTVGEIEMSEDEGFVLFKPRKE